MLPTHEVLIHTLAHGTVVCMILLQSKDMRTMMRTIPQSPGQSTRSVDIVGHGTTLLYLLKEDGL